MLRRHGFAALSTFLAVLTVVLLAVDQEKAAVFVALAAIVLAMVGGLFGATQRD